MIARNEPASTRLVCGTAVVLTDDWKLRWSVDQWHFWAHWPYTGRWYIVGEEYDTQMGGGSLFSGAVAASLNFVARQLQRRAGSRG